MMRSKWPYTSALAVLLLGCSGQVIKPAEVLDERTGMTVAALEQPIEFVQTLPVFASVAGNRASFAYAGPVEWDESGQITYALWVNVAPGNDRQVPDLHSPQVVTLGLDDGPLVLAYTDPPQPGKTPYHAVVSWGKTGYFALTADLLKRLAASNKLEMIIRTPDGASLSYVPSHDTRATLTQFARTRGLTDD